MANGEVVGRSVLIGFVGSFGDAMGRCDVGRSDSGSFFGSLNGADEETGRALAGGSDCCSVVGTLDGI